MLWAAVSMCFFGFLRMGEVIVPSGMAFDPSVHLSVADVSVDSHASPMYVAVNIKVSNTDPIVHRWASVVGMREVLASGLFAQLTATFIESGVTLGLGEGKLHAGGVFLWAKEAHTAAPFLSPKLKRCTPPIPIQG